MYINPRKLWLVAAYEFAEARSSKLLVIILGLYAAGAALASAIFLAITNAAETAARNALAQQMGVPPSAVPENLVQEKLIPGLIEMVEQESLRETLLSMPLLAIFYTAVAMNAVVLLVLATSAGTHAADLQSGAARFSLCRCDRRTWVLGKFAGQAMLLFVGLLVGAAAAGAIGIWKDPHFEASDWLWLFRASAAAWVFGLAFLGLFSGISVNTRSPLVARAFCLVLMIGVWIGFKLTSLEFIQEQVPGIEYLAYLFPGQYREALWVNDPAQLLTSGGALLAFCALGLTAGISLFSRRDA